MDLNKAMVEQYQLRASSRQQKKIPNQDSPKQGKSSDVPDRESQNTNPKVEIMDSSKKKPTKIEEAMAALNFQPTTTFDQLSGIEHLKDDIMDIVTEFKQSIRDEPSESKRPILICGSHGLGKTALIEATANYAQLKIIPIRLRRMIKLTRNEFNETIEQLVRHSIANQPAIVMIDDVDRLSEKQDHKDILEDAISRLSEEPKMLLFCSASNPDKISHIDFEETLELRRPSREARFEILVNMRKNNKYFTNLDDNCLQDMVTNTPAFTPLDLHNLRSIIIRISRRNPTLHHCMLAIKRVERSFKKGTRLVIDKPTITWNHIGGMQKVRSKFADILRRVHRDGNGCKFGGVALYGPPGCGKTMVAQAVANEAGFNFIAISSTELLNKYLGETENNIRQLFREARTHAPCIIYIDEFEGICGTRGHKNNQTGAVQTLLTEMNGFDDRGKVIVMVSTNRIRDIDPAMLRAGRLTYHIFIGPPNQEARKEILSVRTKHSLVELADDVDLDLWAEKTHGFTGADIDLLVYEAELKAENDVASCIGDNELSMDSTDEKKEHDKLVQNKVVLKHQHLIFAIKKIRLENKRQLGKKAKSLTKSKLINQATSRSIKRARLG